jgi:hypothetical protein
LLPEEGVLGVSSRAMKAVPLLFWLCGALAGLTSSSCGGQGAPAVARKGTYTLRLTAQNFPGRRLELKMREAGTTTTLHHYTGSLDPDGRRTIVAEDVLEAGKTYWIDYYVDFDGDGAFTPPASMGFIDPSWRRILTVTADEVRAGRTDSATASDPQFNIAPF